MNLTAPWPPPPPPYKGKFPTGGPVNRKPLWQFLIDFKRQAYASMQLIVHHIEPHPSQYKKNALFLRGRWRGGIQDITPAARIITSSFLKLFLSLPSFSVKRDPRDEKELKKMKKKVSF